MAGGMEFPFFGLSEFEDSEPEIWQRLLMVEMQGFFCTFGISDSGHQPIPPLSAE